MAGNTNFPTALDDDSSLLDVTDGTSTLQAVHHNNTKEAVKAIERKLGIRLTDAPTTIDFRLGNATAGHPHSGASGAGPQINPTVLPLPSGAYPSGGVSIYDHLMAAHGTAVPVPSVIGRFVEGLRLNGSAIVGSNLVIPLNFGKTMQIENVSAALRRGASGATAAFIVRVGPTHVFGASVGLGVRFAPGATRYGQPSPNLSTYPSGAIITLDAEAVGSSAPGEDLSVVFVFRD